MFYSPTSGSNESLWPLPLTPSQHIYEIRPRKGKRGVDLISDTLPFGRLWHGKANAVDYAKLAAVRIQSVIRVYEHAGNVIETHERADGFKDPWTKGAYIKSSRDSAFGRHRQTTLI
jgi:hypothetical protein